MSAYDNMGAILALTANAAGARREAEQARQEADRTRQEASANDAVLKLGLLDALDNMDAQDARVAELERENSELRERLAKLNRDLDYYILERKRWRQRYRIHFARANANEVSAKLLVEEIKACPAQGHHVALQPDPDLGVTTHGTYHSPQSKLWGETYDSHFPNEAPPDWAADMQKGP